MWLWTFFFFAANSGQGMRVLLYLGEYQFNSQLTGIFRYFLEPNYTDREIFSSQDFQAIPFPAFQTRNHFLL